MSADPFKAQLQFVFETILSGPIRFKKLFSVDQFSCVCSHALRTASGQALTSYGRFDVHLQVPPNVNFARVKFEVVDVRFPVCR